MLHRSGVGDAGGGGALDVEGRADNRCHPDHRGLHAIGYQVREAGRVGRSHDHDLRHASCSCWSILFFRAMSQFMTVNTTQRMAKKAKNRMTISSGLTSHLCAA